MKRFVFVKKSTPSYPQMAKTENVTYFKQFEHYKAVIWKVAEVQ